jgi:phage repressor protein C with HTH and peptisase S24 domain
MANASVTSVNRLLTAGVARRISELIADAGGVRALARRADMPPSALSQYRPRDKGRVSKPSTETLAKIARAANVRLDWLLFGKLPKSTWGEIAAESDQSELIHLPRLELRAAAGAGAEVNREDAIQWLAFQADWVRRRLRVPASSLRLITAMGASMRPVIEDGDLLMMTTAEPKFKDNAIHVLRRDNQLLVKRVRRERDGFLLISENPQHETQFARASEIDFIGRVLWRAGRL